MDDFISSIHSELVQTEDVLATVSEGLEEVLLLLGQVAVLLLLLEGEDDLAVAGEGTGQPGPSIPVLINIEDLQVVQKYQDRVSDGGKVQNLRKYVSVLIHQLCTKEEKFLCISGKIR